MKGHLKGLRGKAAAKEADRRARRLDARLGKLDKKLEVARAGLDQQLSAGWRTFEGLRDVLVAAGGAAHHSRACRVQSTSRRAVCADACGIVLAGGSTALRGAGTVVAISRCDSLCPHLLQTR